MDLKIGSEAIVGIRKNTSDSTKGSIARNRRSMRTLNLRILLVLYAYMLLKIILLKFQSLDIAFLWGRLLSGMQQPHLLTMWLDTGNLVPFREISRSLHSLSNNDILNLFGNVAIFIPLGILLGFMFHHKAKAGMKIVGYAFFVSLSLESAELLIRIGQFDVDDILLNSLGGFLGFVIYRTTLTPCICGIGNESSRMKVPNDLENAVR